MPPDAIARVDDGDVVLDAHSVPQLHAALDGDAISDDHVVLDENVVADVAVVADHRAGQDVGERPDPSAGADSVGLDEGIRVSEERSLLAHAVGKTVSSGPRPEQAGQSVQGTLAP